MTAWQLVFAGAVVGLPLLAEWWVSASHARLLRGRGAVEPPDDVHAVMAVAYPAVFVAALLEGAGRGVPLAAGGLVLLVAAKALKYWAAATLGDRWTFKVLVVPGEPLVAAGPYRWLRHPNYVAVVGEILGVAWLVSAPVAGLVGLGCFGWLLRRRIRVEERALGLAGRVY